MNSTYNEQEVLILLQDEKTQRRGFEIIVAQYSEQLYWQIRRMVYSHEDTNDLLHEPTRPPARLWYGKSLWLWEHLHQQRWLHETVSQLL